MAILRVQGSSRSTLVPDYGDIREMAAASSATRYTSDCETQNVRDAFPLSQAPIWCLPWCWGRILIKEEIQAARPPTFALIPAPPIPSDISTLARPERHPEPPFSTTEAIDLLPTASLLLFRARTMPITTDSLLGLYS